MQYDADCDIVMRQISLGSAEKTSESSIQQLSYCITWLGKYWRKKIKHRQRGVISDVPAHFEKYFLRIFTGALTEMTTSAPAVQESAGRRTRGERLCEISNPNSFLF